MQVLGVFHNLFELLLGVKIRAVLGVGPVAAVFHVGKPTVGGDGTDGSKTRIFLDFNAPSLVLGEMPVEVVHLVDGHEVEKTFYLFHAEEMAALIEHEAAVGKARR